MTGMNPDITEDEKAAWKVQLALRLRTVNGDAFQDFFADLMRAWHGDNFVPIRAHGSLGDKGCDGYTLGDGRVYQCYGAVDAKLNVATFTRKMSTDFAAAKAKLPQIMKRWSMVHNLEALPIDVLLHFQSMAENHPQYDMKMMARDGFEAIIFNLPTHKIKSLIGPALVLKGALDLNAVALKELIAGIAKAANDPAPPAGDPKPVPDDKMEFNKVPWHWRRSLQAHMLLTPIIAEYFEYHGDPTVGDQVAVVLRNRYLELKQQGLPPGTILDALLESVVNSGAGLPTTAIQQAGITILAHFFDSCEVFEDHPMKVPA